MEGERSEARWGSGRVVQRCGQPRGGGGNRSWVSGMDDVHVLKDETWGWGGGRGAVPAGAAGTGGGSVEEAC